MSVPAAADPARSLSWPRWSDLVELTKPRLSSLVLLTVAVGAIVAAPAGPSWESVVLVVVGMSLTVGGANAVNQYAERDADALMVRTRDRPLPSGRLQPVQALSFGSSISLLGIVWLYVAVNPLTALLAATAWALYVFAYTPLKRRTSWCTLVGAVPGAMPPLIGWTAVTGSIDIGAWGLFLIVFFWQMPHFLAISRLCRDDYARAGFPMLAVLDEDGSRAARASLIYALALVPASAVPTVVGVTGTAYLAGSLALSVGLAALVAWAARCPGARRQRWVFFATLVFLPVLMALLVADRLPLG